MIQSDRYYRNIAIRTCGVSVGLDKDFTVTLMNLNVSLVPYSIMVFRFLLNYSEV